MIGPVIKIVNRAPYPLVVVKDGKQTTLQPGENHINSDLVRFAKAQHPIPGTQNPNTLECEYLVGVVGTRDPIDPIPLEVLQMLPAEKLDRTKMSPDKQKVIEKRVQFPIGRHGAAMEAVTSNMVEGAGITRVE